MNRLLFSEQFEKSFLKLKENPFWSIHVNRYRIIYQFEYSTVIILDILERKHSYH